MAEIDPARTGDAELAAIAADDSEAFARWLAGAEPRLRRGLASFATSIDVESVVQDVLFRAWNVADRLDQHASGDTLLRWSVRAARNLAIDEARRLGGRMLELGDHDLDAEGELPPPPDPFLREILDACREQLPRQPARALAARLETAGVVDDRSLAARVGMRLNTFLQNITRARRLLADCLRGRGVDLGLPGGES